MTRLLLIWALCGSAAAQVTQGNWIKVLDTGSVQGKQHYVNDHTFIRAADGRWHLFGIFHEEPFGPDYERSFIHAVAPSLEPSKWTASVFQFNGDGVGMRADTGESHIWAPHIVRDGDRYVMAYQSGGPNDQSRISLAQSNDLEHWQKLGAAFEDICVARDPMLKKVDDLWVVYYTRCDSKLTRLSGVAYRTSKDLSKWSEPSMALVLRNTPPMSNSGYTESPFVFEYCGWYYLSVTSYPVDWAATFLYRSHDPFQFPDVPFARLTGHAAEWIQDSSGALFMSHAGAGQKGVFLIPIPTF